MKKLTLLLALSFIMFFSFAQEMKYSRVRIYTDVEGISTLLAAGIPVDDAEIRPGAYVTCEISDAEILKVDLAGFKYEVLIDDVEKYYEDRSAKEMHMLDELKKNPYVKPDRPAYPDRSGFGIAPQDK